MSRRKWIVMVSGYGALLEASLKSGLRPDLVIADRPCKGLGVADMYGVPTELIRRANYGKPFDRVRYSRELAEFLVEREIDFVSMAGFETVLDKVFFQIYTAEIINNHPSLLPGFQGERDAVQAAFDMGVKVTGCTIHRATAVVDKGEILFQQAVDVLPGDTVDTLRSRIKAVEQVALPRLIKQLLELEEEPPATLPFEQLPHSDAPYCYNCGVQMQRAGSVYACVSCGTTSQGGL